jgi:hypothetical protein
MRAFSGFLATCVCTLLLAACGGGGDAPAAADAADKYVGTWVMSCNATGANSSETETVVITKSTATTVTATLTLTAFANGTCAGAGTESVNTAAVTIDGQTSVTYNGGPQQVDQLTAVVTGPDAGTYKWLGTVVGNQLVIDFEDNHTPSATTYPSDTSDGLTAYVKQ